MWKVNLLFLSLCALHLTSPALTLPAPTDTQVIPILKPNQTQHEIPILKPNSANVTTQEVDEDLDAIVVEGGGTSTTPPESNDESVGATEEFDPSDCFLPKERGPCRAVIESWFFNTVTKACEPFSWSGCQGNKNRFPDQLDCEARCTKPNPGPGDGKSIQDESGSSALTQDPGTNTSTIPPPRKHPLPHCPKFEGCVEKCVIIQDRSDRGCKKCLCGSEEPSTPALPSNITLSSGNLTVVKESSPVSVGSVSGLSPETEDADLPIQGNPADNCQLPNRRGHCRAMMTRYHYEPQLKDCVVFHYGGCDGNPNNFVSREKCLEYCKGQ